MARHRSLHLESSSLAPSSMSLSSSTGMSACVMIDLRSWNPLEFGYFGRMDFHRGRMKTA
eukprot:CAMPEP_0197236756 /NCGR_PEP_ID=MMETSP1429-20130617/3777_1 /TAXON_ID=49237 /ORGANISM="Chaetoceros  sp., Strain UNC1202" /LENGTH=59 /DNA_ID=CAMNT_0042695623 /DNA_START=219 /DNA_END=398 /DNA_ORIENTATION=+